MRFTAGGDGAGVMPLGLSLGIPAASLVGMFPAVNGYFFIPNYGTLHRRDAVRPQRHDAQWHVL